MNIEGFLQKMKVALEGQVSDFVIKDNIKYYRNYIQNEISNGKSEAEVLEMLGDPRLLAKTIIELQGTNNRETNNRETNNSETNGYNEYKKNNQDDDQEYNQDYDNFSKGTGKSKRRSFLGFRGCLISLIVLFVIFALLKFVLSIAIYFAVPICIILVIVTLFKNLR